jgi:hypothetical protein
MSNADIRLQQIMDYCTEPRTANDIAVELGISGWAVRCGLRALRAAKCIETISQGERFEFGWRPQYLAIPGATVPYLDSVYRAAQAKKIAGFRAPQNVGWLISHPTFQPTGGRKVMLAEAYHTVGSPRKLSPWHGYSCEVMG